MRTALFVPLTILFIGSTTSTVFDDVLRDFMEFLRLQMRCGYKPAGIPALSPYETDFMQLKITRKNLNIHANFSDFTINGLDKFDVQALNFNNVLRKVKYDLNFGEIISQGDYKMDLFTSKFGKAMHLFGDGQMKLTLENLRVRGSFKFQPNLSGGVNLVAFKSKMELGAVKSELTNFQNSKLFTKLFNSWVEEFLQLIVNDNSDELSVALHSLIVPPINEAMKNISFMELLALIFGLAGSDVIPNQPIC